MAILILYGDQFPVFHEVQMERFTYNSYFKLLCTNVLFQNLEWNAYYTALSFFCNNLENKVGEFYRSGENRTSDTMGDKMDYLWISFAFLII